MNKNKKYKPIAGRVIIGIYCFLIAVVVICAVAVIIISAIQKGQAEAATPPCAEEICYGGN